MFDKVVVQQVDLDTCVAALVCSVTRWMPVAVVRSTAAPEDLRNPRVLCIEAGGSGRIVESNFDHHEPSGPTQPACVQALRAMDVQDPSLERLVAYAAGCDAPRSSSLRPCQREHDGQEPGMCPSALFSGMRLVVFDPVAQLHAGLGILLTLLREDIDPFGAMPRRPEWDAYTLAKEDGPRMLAETRARVEVLTSVSSLRVGFVETDVTGALGLIYSMDCDIAIAYSPRFISPAGGAIAKYTIGGKDGRRIDHLLPALNEVEPGWGGPSHTIIASPREGTSLPPEAIRDIVARHG